MTQYFGRTFFFPKQKIWVVEKIYFIFNNFKGSFVSSFGNGMWASSILEKNFSCHLECLANV